MILSGRGARALVSCGSEWDDPSSLREVASVRLDCIILFCGKTTKCCLGCKSETTAHPAAVKVPQQSAPSLTHLVTQEQDPSENAPAVRCLMRIAQDASAREHLAPHMTQLLTVLVKLASPEAASMKPPLATAELQAEIKQFVAWLLSARTQRRAPELAAQLPACALGPA
jgi:hypothetical protein